MDERLWQFSSAPRTTILSGRAGPLRRCPHLAVFGGADELVSVADSTRRFSAAACHPDRHHQAALTIEVFPGASHRIQVDASAYVGHRHPGPVDQSQNRYLIHLSMRSRMMRSQAPPSRFS